MPDQTSTSSRLDHVRTQSSPSDLKITDMRFADIAGAPMHCTLLKLYTNQGLVGFGEVRDAADKLYALQLKSRLLGENPCDVDKLFRRIKQFGGQARQGGRCQRRRGCAVGSGWKGLWRSCLPDAGRQVSRPCAYVL